MVYNANSSITILTLEPVVLPILAGCCVYNDRIYHAGDAMVVSDASCVFALTDLELGYVSPFEGPSAAAVDEVFLVPE
jgi:hypothetical protein